MSRAVKLACVILLGITVFAIVPAVIFEIIHPHNGRHVFYFDDFCFILRLIVIVAGLYHLHKLFANYAEGKIFTIRSVVQIKKIGIIILFMGGIVLIQSISDKLSFLYIQNLHELGVRFNDVLFCCFRFFVQEVPLGYFIMGVLFILISLVMETGIQMREENELTI